MKIKWSGLFQFQSGTIKSDFYTIFAGQVNYVSIPIWYD